MNEYDATKQAYDNGYEAGVKDFAKFLIDKSQDRVINICDIPDLVKEAQKKCQH